MNTPLIAGLTAATALLASVGVAHAEPDSYRSPTTAALLSLGGPMASGLLIFGGIAFDGASDLAGVGLVSLLVTPSLGQFYSHNYLSAGLLVRGAGAGLLGIAASCLFRCEDSTTEALAVSGVVAVLSGAVLDIALAATSAEKFNAKHGLTIAPTAISTPTGTSAGLGFSGRF